MLYLKKIWLVVNIIIICLVLIRSPNEQSVQEILEPFDLFESSRDTKKNLDVIISIFALFYFVLAFFSNF